MKPNADARTRGSPVGMVTQLLGGGKLQLGRICPVFLCTAAAGYGNLPCNWSLIVLMALAESKTNTSNKCDAIFEVRFEGCVCAAQILCTALWQIDGVKM